MHRLFAGSLILLTLTACTGTSEPQVPFKVVVQEQSAATEVNLKIWQIGDEMTALTSIPRSGVATGMQNTDIGSYIFAGYEDRIEVYVADGKEPSGIRAIRSLSTGTDGVFKMANCTNPVKLQKPVLSSNDGFLLVLGQCGDSDVNQYLWGINLNSATPENWTPIQLVNNLVTPIKFFTASGSQAFFATKNNIGDFTLNAVSLFNPTKPESSNKTFPSNLNGLEYWQNSLRYSDGSKIGTVKTLSTLELSDLVAYPASALFRKQNQLLAFSSSRGTACLLDATPNCDDGSDVIRFVSDARDVTFDLDGYFWMVAGSALYRVDAVASNKQLEFQASVTNPRGVAWVVN